MGKTIEGLSPSMNFQVTEIYNEENPFLEATTTGADVAIDFTQPDLAVSHIKHAVDLKLPIVVGTTGWYHEFDDVADYVTRNEGSLFYATNFSIGVNLFFAINEFVAKIMNQYPDYTAGIEEIHHTEKKDAPSGTAITLAEKTLKHLTRVSNFELVEELETYQGLSLPIKAIREPNVPGTHTLTFQNNIDKISITHEAKSRLGFAQGAVHAAFYLKDKTGIFSMSDLLKINE